MFKLLSKVENLLYGFRDFLWSYPNFLILDDNSLYSYFHQLYYLSRPGSHIVLSILVTISISAIAFNTSIFAGNNENSTLIEGAVMGIEDNGLIQQIDTVNPLIPSKFQLGSDLANMIYEPLIETTSTGIEYKLASGVAPTKDDKQELTGIDYIFNLRQDVFWHDGNQFTSLDVVATFNKLVELADAEIAAGRSSALQQMGIVAIDEFTVRIFVEQEPGAKQDQLFPNFLELVSFKILPAKYLDEVNSLTVATDEPQINRRPVGTGPFKFESSEIDQISLKRFDSYYGDKGNIDRIVFKLYKTEDALINALKNGEVHSYASNSTKHIRDLESFPKILQYESDVQYQQYWAIYFNLKDGPDYLKDPVVRKALAKSINYQKLLESILNKGVSSSGPIPAVSEYFFAEGAWPEYSLDEAKQDLLESGWELNGAGKLVKNGASLYINVKYTDHYDRNQVIDSITTDWEQLGATVETEALSLSTIKNDLLIPRLFDTIMYGMNTFIDPDRYELFHSSAIDYPGLNISAYQSTIQTKKIVDRKVVDVPKSDRALEIGRSTIDKNIRSQEYKDFQQLIINDQPVIFLYHPTFTYYASRSLSGIDLEGVDTINNRFKSISNWRFD